MDQTITVDQQHVGQRLDVFCKVKFPLYSRAALQKLIKTGAISLKGHPVKPGYVLKANDVISVILPSANITPSPPAPLPTIPILHENPQFIIINKPAGLIVHTDQPQEPSVAAWFKDRYPDSSFMSAEQERPGIVHRLDKDTSGVMILAKTAAAMQHYKEQFKKHYAKKEYLALVFGELNGNDGRINQAIIRSRRNPSRRTIVPKTKATILSGKMAITEWRIEKALTKNYTLLRVYPLTGRTHQIRVHLHFIGHPIVGDHLYTFKRQQSPPGVKRQMLHAEKLTIKLPTGVRKSYRAPLPEDFVTVLQGLHYDTNQLNTDEKPTAFRTPSSFKSRSARNS